VKTRRLTYTSNYHKEMQSTNVNNNATHCKVQCGNEFRRFLLPNSQYEDLANQIRALFGFGQDEILSLKYTDEEGDMVTISSDNELKFAIGLFAGGLLRLTICNKKGRNCKGAQFANGERKKWERPEGQGQMWKAKWDAKMQANPELLQSKIEKLQTKVAAMKDRKQWLENKATKDNFNPSIPHRIAHFQVKLQRLEPRLAHLQSLAGVKAAPVPATVDVAPSAPPAAPADLFRQTKDQIRAKKEQMFTLRTQVREGTLPRSDAAEKIFLLKEEIGQLREQLNANRHAMGETHQKWQGRGRGAKFARKDTA